MVSSTYHIRHGMFWLVVRMSISHMLSANAFLPCPPKRASDLILVHHLLDPEC
jgi:hypothetical protein